MTFSKEQVDKYLAANDRLMCPRCGHRYVMAQEYGSQHQLAYYNRRYCLQCRCHWREAAAVTGIEQLDDVAVPPPSPWKTGRVISTGD